ELMELVNLTPYADVLVRELSTGTKRVVELACALAHRPTVLLLDEPSTGLAQREAEALQALLLVLREQLDATILIIEHDTAALVAIGISGVVNHGSGSSTATTTTGTTLPVAGQAPATAPGFRPAGVLSWSQAKAEGKTASIDWGARCDTTTGRLKYPSFFAGE